VRIHQLFIPPFLCLLLGPWEILKLFSQTFSLRKNVRSHSITSSTTTATNSHHHPQIKIPEYKNINKSTKSLSGKLTSSHSENQQKEEKALSVGDVPLNSGKMENSISNEFNKENGNLAENQNSAAPADKLSIKSGVSMAASSNSVFFLTKGLGKDFRPKIRIFCPQIIFFSIQIFSLTSFLGERESF